MKVLYKVDDLTPYFKKREDKMIKILIPQDKKQGKTKARGFWYSKDSHKIFYDYLIIAKLNKKEITDFKELYYRLDFYKRVYNQEAIFYVKDNIGYCYYTRDNIEVLTNRIYKEVSRVNLKQEIKRALRVYGGITIYQESGRYYIEIYF